MSYEQFWQPLTSIYPTGEAKAIARLVLEVHCGLSMTDIVCGKATTLDERELAALQARLLQGEPVQYVIGEADFGGHLFMVGPGVLIPRPETLWLCKTVCQHIGTAPRKVLDIGTGSGCIAITIARERPTATVTAWDVSNEALQLARRNAARQEVDIDFEHQDMLSAPDDHEMWDAIVSNPPYICQQEQAAMEHHVLDFEPHLALFVPDDDPLLFYRSIARYAIKALKQGGALYLEINPIYANDLADLLHHTGFRQVSIHKDDFDKDRYIIACK